MSSNYSTIQQHEPLRVPSNWSTQERKVIAQLEEILDDIYSRFNRLKMSDLGKELRSTIVSTYEGVNGLTTRVSQAEIDIDAAEAAIALKASQSTVDNLSTRLTQAEIDIDGAEAAIALKASQQSVDALGTRMSQAEIDIDGAEAAIALKVSQTDYNGNTIASLINQTATTVLIQAEHINLVGKVTAADLNATDIFATNANIKTLIAANIDVDTLFARQAAIDKITAMDISGNEYLHLYVEGASSRNFTGWADPALTASNNVHDGDIWSRSTDLHTWNDMAANTWTQLSSKKWNQVESYTWDYIETTSLADQSVHTWATTNGTWNDFEAGKQYIRDNDAWVLMNDTSGKYSIVSGVDINQYGVTISGQKYIKMISGGEIQIKAGGKFTVDSGNFSIDSSGNVTVSGVITATSGKIADWDIQPGKLKSGSGTGSVAVSSSTSDEYAVWAGAEAASSAPFRVARDGTTYVTKLVTVAEGGGSTTTINLMSYPLWKLYYHAIRSYNSSSITLTNNAVINFNTAAGIVLSGGWTDNWTRYTVEAIDSNSQVVSTISSGVVAIWLGGSTATQANVKAALESASNHRANITVEADGEVIQPLTIDASGVYSGAYNTGYSDGEASVIFYSEGVWSGGSKTLTLSNGATKTVSIPDPASWSGSYVGNSIMAVTAMVGGKALNGTVDASDVYAAGQSSITVTGWDAYFNASGVTVYVTLSNGLTRSHFFAE